MKKLFISFSLLLSLGAHAQLKEGKVVYERLMQMRRPPDMSKEMRNLLPPTRKDNFELLFGNNQSLWQVIPDPDGDNGTVTGPGMVFRMAGNDDVIHFNFISGKRTDQREIFDRQYLVEDSVQKLLWKLSDETRTFLGYSVRKATAQRIGTRSLLSMENGQMKRQQVADTSAITAWFTSEIPIAAGPQEFQGQLPGLIVELDLNNGQVVYKAVEISPKINVASIREPRGGKRITGAEFTKERERLMEEMRRNNPGGNTIIRIN